MNPVSAAPADPLGQAQISMLRKAMDMALQTNATLLASMPPPAPPAGRVDAYA